MLTIKPEPFSVVEQNQHLIVEHWDEVATTEYGKMDIDWETFNLLDSINKILTIVARYDDEVIGYAIFLIHNHLHAKETLLIDCDAVFMKKSYRKTGLGVDLIEKSQEIISQKFGQCTILWHVKPHVDFSHRLEKIGYKKYETIYSLRIM